MKGNFLTSIKAIYKNPTGNIVISGEKLKYFSYDPVQSKDAQSQYYVVLEVLARATRQENNFKHLTR